MAAAAQVVWRRNSRRFIVVSRYVTAEMKVTLVSGGCQSPDRTWCVNLLIESLDRNPWQNESVDLRPPLSRTLEIDVYNCKASSDWANNPSRLNKSNSFAASSDAS